MKQILQFASFVTRFELCITLILLLVFLLPVWTLHAMPTLDGPAHIYNSKVVWQLWMEPSSWMHQFMMVNKNPSPNWIVQPLMGMLSQFFSPYVVEKIMLSSLITSFIFAFRYFVFTILPAQKSLALLGFVFVYNSPLILGYYNYNIGITLFFCATAFLFRFSSSPSWRSSITFALLCIALFFSHLIACALFGLTASFIILRDMVMRSNNSVYAKTNTWLKLLPGIIPVLILFVGYFLNNRTSGSLDYMKPMEIAERIITFSANCCVSGTEHGFSRWIYFVVIGGTLISLLFRLPKINQLNLQFRKDNSGVFIIVGIFFILLICTFLLPDGTSGGGGALTQRLIFLTGAFMTLLAFTLFRNQLLQLLMVLVLVVVHVDKVNFLRKYYAQYEQYLIDVESASHELDQPGFLVALDFRGAYPFGHVSKQLGVNHGLLMMDSWSHKPFNCLQWKSEYIFDPQLLCWVADQWNCDPVQVERRLNQKLTWITTVEEEHLSGRSEHHAGQWQSFLADSCLLHQTMPGSIKIYRRK